MGVHALCMVPCSHMHGSATVLVLHQDLPDPQLDAETQQAFDTAYENIRAFHEAQHSPPLEVETMPGVRCRRVTRPIGAPSPLPLACYPLPAWHC